MDLTDETDAVIAQEFLRSTVSTLRKRGKSIEPAVLNGLDGIMGNLLRKSLAQSKVRKEEKDLIQNWTPYANSLLSTPAKSGGNQMDPIEIMTSEETIKSFNLNNSGGLFSPVMNKMSQLVK